MGFYALCFKIYLLHFMFYILCFMFYVLCFVFYVLCFMFCVLCFMFSVLCFVFGVLEFWSLTERKSWKKQWKQYTGYLRNHGFPLDNKLYAEMLLNKCDVTMKLPLEVIDNLYPLGEELVWDKIESI